MPVKKNKTNEQALNALMKDVKNTNTMFSALLRERLLKISYITRASITENAKEWENGFVHPSMYLMLCDLIDKHLNFDQ